MGSQIILYVRSKKGLKRNLQVGGYKYEFTRGRPVGYSAGVSPSYPRYDVETVVEHDFVLPEDQQRMLKDVEKLASEHDFTLKIVDLTRESAFSKWKFDHPKRIKTLPALVTDSGEIAEGFMTKEEIDAFLTKQTDQQPKS